MKLFDMFRKKKRPKPRPQTGVDEDGNLVISVRVDGYDKFVEQIEGMSQLVDTLSDKMERLGELAEPVTIVNNHYDLHVETGKTE